MIALATPGPSGEAVTSDSAGAGASTAAQASVRVDTAKWESGYGAKFFQVVGTVTNMSAKPLAAVRVRTELLDGSGKVVAKADVWNARAEGLGDAVGDAARAELAKLHPAPLEPGGGDRFRATFLEEETPKFASQRVGVVATLPAE